MLMVPDIDNLIMIWSRDSITIVSNSINWFSGMALHRVSKCDWQGIICFKTFTRLHALIKAILSHVLYRYRAPINYFIHAWDLSASRALILFCTFYVTSLSRCIVFRSSVRLWSIITSLINSIFTSGKKQRADIVRDNIFTISSIVHNSHKSVYLDFHLVNNVTLVVIFVWYINRIQSQCLSPEARFSVSWVDQRHLCIWLWYFIPDSAFLVFDRFKNFSEL